MNMNVEALKNGVKLPDITKKLPKVAVASGISGLIVAALILMTPNPWFEAFIVETGLPGLISAAEPPLGARARIVFALIAALLVTVVAWFGLKAVMASRFGQAINDPVSIYDMDNAVGDLEAPTLRRADAHPDHPPRAPIMAGDDLGMPLDLVNVVEDNENYENIPQVDADIDPTAFNAESPLWDKPMSEEPDMDLAEPNAFDSHTDKDAENPLPSRKRTFGPQPDAKPVLDIEEEADAEIADEPKPDADEGFDYEQQVENDFDRLADSDDLDDDYEVVEWDETGDEETHSSSDVNAFIDPQGASSPEETVEPDAVQTRRPNFADAEMSDLIVRLEAGLDRRRERFRMAQEAAAEELRDNIEQHPGALPNSDPDMDSALREALDALKKVTAKGA